MDEITQANTFVHEYQPHNFFLKLCYSYEVGGLEWGQRYFSIKNCEIHQKWLSDFIH